MNFVQAMLLAVGAVVVMSALLAAAIFARKGVHPPTYSMSDEWTHPPILWAAIDEDILGHAPSHDGHTPAESSAAHVGGGASGRW